MDLKLWINYKVRVGIITMAVGRGGWKELQGKDVYIVNRKSEVISGILCFEFGGYFVEPEDGSESISLGITDNIHCVYTDWIEAHRAAKKASGLDD